MREPLAGREGLARVVSPGRAGERSPECAAEAGRQVAVTGTGSAAGSR